MEFWSRVKFEMNKLWVSGKKKIKEKVDRLENTYKGAESFIGSLVHWYIGSHKLP